MSLLDHIKSDIRQIVGNGNEFSVSILFENKQQTLTARVNGLHTKHHLPKDTEGAFVNTLNIHITIIEKDLTDLGYVVRDSENKVNLKGHYASITDINSNDIKYIVREVYPDELLGSITLMLGAFDPGLA